MSFIKPKLIGGIPNKLASLDKNVIIYVDQYDINLNNYNHNDYDYKIYWQIEGQGVINGIGNNISFPIQHKNEFDLIIASDPTILRECENSVIFPFGDCWIPVEEQKVHDKNKLLSIIASEKNYLPGHTLRHLTIKNVGDKMDIYGKCCKFVENKSDALKDYMFSICTENLQIDNWFTEKLIDCLRTGTVPIYWGSSNIGDYFNVNGFIIVNSIEEIVDVVNNLTEEQYISKLKYVEENFITAAKYGNNLFDRVDNEIKKLINE
jgi:hypothetical protein